jgi:hypothetical protein
MECYVVIKLKWHVPVMSIDAHVNIVNCSLLLKLIVSISYMNFGLGLLQASMCIAASCSDLNDKGEVTVTVAVN